MYNFSFFVESFNASVNCLKVTSYEFNSENFACIENAILKADQFAAQSGKFPLCFKYLIRYHRVPVPGLVCAPHHHALYVGDHVVPVISVVQHYGAQPRGGHAGHLVIGG